MIDIRVPDESWSILDQDGVIVAVSHSWFELAQQFSTLARQSGLGIRYLDFCTSADAQGIAAQVGDLLEGRVRRFAWVYDCGSSTEFVPVACLGMALPGDGEFRFLLRHINMLSLRADIATQLNVDDTVEASLKNAFSDGRKHIHEMAHDGQKEPVLRALRQLGIALDAIRIAHDELVHLGPSENAVLTRLTVQTASAMDAIVDTPEKRVV